MSDFYEPQGDVGANACLDVSGPSYPLDRPITLVSQAALALALAVPLSSPSVRPEEQWARVFPQYSTVLSSLQEGSPTRGTHAPRVLPHTAEQLATVQTVFGLSKTQLAQVCGVQRQTVYDWYAGNFQAEGNNERRLARLFDIAEKLQAAGRRPLSARVVTRALGSGNSLLALLTDEDADRDEIGAVVAQLEEATAAMRSRGASATRDRLGWKATSTESAEENLESNLDDFVDG
jgi:DNA-binding XRE family transcriptional regulator